jgi:hypothetical protein
LGLPERPFVKKLVLGARGLLNLASYVDVVSRIHFIFKGNPTASFCADNQVFEATPEFLNKLEVQFALSGEEARLIVSQISTIAQLSF